LKLKTKINTKQILEFNSGNCVFVQELYLLFSLVSFVFINRFWNRVKCLHFREWKWSL